MFILSVFLFAIKNAEKNRLIFEIDLVNCLGVFGLVSNHL
jgi:hypothetical protein